MCQSPRKSQKTSTIPRMTMRFPENHSGHLCLNWMMTMEMSISPRRTSESLQTTTRTVPGDGVNEWAGTTTYLEGSATRAMDLSRQGLTTWAGEGASTVEHEGCRIFGAIGKSWPDLTETDPTRRTVRIRTAGLGFRGLALDVGCSLSVTEGGVGDLASCEVCTKQSATQGLWTSWPGSV